MECWDDLFGQGGKSRSQPTRRRCKAIFLFIYLFYLFFILFVIQVYRAKNKSMLHVTSDAGIVLRDHSEDPSSDCGRGVGD